MTSGVIPSASIFLVISTFSISFPSVMPSLAMSHLDNDVAEIFKIQEMDTAHQIEKIFKKCEFDVQYSKEKIHLMMHLIEDLCHELVYHKHSEINYDIMKSITIETVINILSV